MRKHLLALPLFAACLIAGTADAAGITYLEVTPEQFGIEQHTPPPESFGTLGIRLGMSPDEIREILLKEGYQVQREYKSRNCMSDYCVQGYSQTYIHASIFSKPDSRISVDFDTPILGNKATEIVRTDVAENFDIQTIADGMRQKLGNPAENAPETPDGKYCWAAKDGEILPDIDLYSCNSFSSKKKDARYSMSLFREKMEITIEDLVAQENFTTFRDAFNKFVAKERQKITAPSSTPKL